MESFVVRIYRRDEKDPRKIAGLVEVIDKGETKKFSSFEDLWGILAARTEKVRPKGKKRR